jgi:hypothetical protein
METTVGFGECKLQIRSLPKIETINIFDWT